MTRAEVIDFMRKYIVVLFTGIVIFFLVSGFGGAYGFLIIFTLLAILWVLLSG